MKIPSKILSKYLSHRAQQIQTDTAGAICPPVLRRDFGRAGNHSWLPAVFVALLTLPGCFNDFYVTVSPILPGGTVGDLEEVQLHPTRSGESSNCLFNVTPSGTKILLLPIDGVIGEGGFMPGSFTNPGYVKQVLDRASADPEIKAIVLRIDSPGGTVSASDLIYRMLLDYGKQKGVPVYAHIADIGASGGYYVAMSAKNVNARPMAIVGSIGVIIRGFGVAGLMNKLGIEYRSITSGKMKDSLSPFKEFTEEERAFFMKQIDRSYDNFLNVILESRSDRINRDALRALADGRVLDAGQALEHKLIDSTGYIEDYLTKIAGENNWQNIRVVAYLPEGRSGPSPNLYSIGGSAPISAADKILLLAQLSGHRLFYLWEAGL